MKRIQPMRCILPVLALAATLGASGAALGQSSGAQTAPAAKPQSTTPNLCSTIARDIASRYVVQLVSGAPQRADREPDPLIGRFATAVMLYDTLLCPMPPLVTMLECLQVAANETGGDMRTMIGRRRDCETVFTEALFGR